MSDCQDIFPDNGPHTGGSETPRKQEEVWWQRIQETGQQPGGETDNRVCVGRFITIIPFTGHHGDGKRGKS